MSKRLSPTEMLNQVRSKAKLEDSEFSKQIAIKLNKEGKIKFQLLALDSDNLFIPRTQHFIPKIPGSESDSKQKIIVCDCLGENCPICSAALAFRNSGVELDTVNETYSNKYPYQNLRSVFTQPEHFLLGARILLDSPDEGSYLPKDAQIGSTQLIQFSRTALNSLMQAYEDYLEDSEIGDDSNFPSLFAIFDDKDKVNSFIINCRIQTSPYSYTFSFGKSNEISIKDVDVEKLKLLSGLSKPADEYVESAVKRVKDITNFFTSSSFLDEDEDDIPFDINENDSSTKSKSIEVNTVDDDDDDFDLEL